MKLRKLIRDYLSFSKTEVNGVIVLIPLIVFFILSPYFYRQVFGIKYNTNQEDKRLLDSLVSLIDEGFQAPELNRPIKLFEFNPNTTIVSDLNRLGIPSFLSKRIDNYRNKGGTFRVKKDLAKIFDFPDSLYQQLEDYITLPNKLEFAKKEKVPEPKALASEKPPVSYEREEPLKESVFVLNLNEADTTALKRIKGIGPSYAKRIVGYRKLLGGFHSIGQLKEIYGMTDTLYHAIGPFLSISDSSIVKQVAINLATFKELLAHPYINYEQTKEIMNLKSSQGKYAKPEDLFRLTLMDSLEVRRLLPYIRF